MSATAVIITGQLRTFAHCWKTQREAVFRKLENPYFFVSVDREEDAIEAMAILQPKYGVDRVFVEFVEQPPMPEENRERYEAESWHAPWYRSVPVDGIWKQLWHLARGWEFFNECDANPKCPPLPDFDRFVRIRPDLHVHNWTPPQIVEPFGPDYHPYPATVFVPWWCSWGGCPDRFAYIVGADAAAQYFNVFHRINELLAEGCAYHPETMLARALERAGVRVHHTMDAEFTTIRTKEDLAKGKQHDKPSYSNRDVFNYINARLGEGDLR